MEKYMQELTLDEIGKKYDMSITQVNYSIKKTINKMVDRLKPEFDADGGSVFDIVVAISEFLCVEPGDIYTQLNPKNKHLCEAIAAKKAPYLAEEAIRNNGYENIVD